ncbi:glycoside hydrolase family 35 protein [Dendrothele bispora CBS 962.96]|uniref:beta-galactosidase n=1 Tax=Dendrothele bispora (strain CBS 962.96) TaxID=1314807 RepID=A0A4S8MIK1_DENBC|nr:glycoside hydrolase family 35 protein [Dendrothele bispora CBS 962.96]
MLRFFLLLLWFWAAGASSNFHRRNSTGLTDEVTWDPHSLSIQGQRIFILSAEIHPWRLPGNPDLWADLFQKVKSNGFNTVSFYVNWATHYPEPSTNDGNGDFEEGTYRDIQRFIDEAKKAGLWLIARPGPYISGFTLLSRMVWCLCYTSKDGETTGGGFPGWVGNIAGDLRTDNPNYTQGNLLLSLDPDTSVHSYYHRSAWTPYLNTISKIIAKNQITEGGPIILVQAENEFSAGTTRSPYMQMVIDTYRANGITIPIIHNDQHAGQAGNFSPDLPGTGRVNIYCGDSYPQGGSRWAQVQSIYFSAHENVAPNNPLCLAEFGGGFLLQWGSVTPFGGTGYEKFSNDLTNATYENVFYKENYAQTATILNIYMLFGGTNWGQTAAPVSYTSYDYGGGINENRVANSKMNEMRQQGLFLRVSRDLLGSTLLANGTNYTTNSLIHTAELRNLETGAGFYVTRHNDSTSLALTTTQLTVQTSRGESTIPQTTDLTFNGRESKIIVTDYVFGASTATILYSTAEIMTWTTIDDTDYVILYAPAGQTGETVFLSDEEPTVDLSDAPNASSTFSNGALMLNYTLEESHFVSIQINGKPITVILMDKAVANEWHAPVISAEGTFGNYFSVGTNETVLVSGPYVLRSAELTGDTLVLVGDLNGTTPVEFIAPSGISELTWNGASVELTPSSRGSLTGTLEASSLNITLPSLGDWKVMGSLPEVDNDFDDTTFTVADLTTTNYTNLPPVAGTQVLYLQQYGFYGGNLIFRGRFNATGDETGVNLTVQYGFGGGYSAFLNGVFLGSGQGNSTVSLSTDVWTFPDGALRTAEENFLVVVQDHMGISETSSNGGKEPRGIRGYSLIGGNTTFTSWTLQGNQGGAANTPDTFRGYLNEGGLYAERIGAHLPGFPDDSWDTGSPLDGTSKAGINFYRTTFDLPISGGLDVPVRLSITPSDVTSNFRVQIYLNGWQVGKYINNIGPQTVFVLPAGILRRKSTNTLALSLWSLDSRGASVAGLELISDGTFSTALQFTDYESPDYADQQDQRPTPTNSPAM